MEMYNTYYLHIDSANLGYYFDYACIYPYNYYDKVTPDFQKVQKDMLILSSKKWNHICDCSIEVIVTQTELQNLIMTDFIDVYFYSKPIPVSRIKNIYFNDYEVKDRVVFNINVSTAFIPDHLIKVEQFDEDQILRLEKPIQQTTTEITWGSEQVAFFDQILGGFSLLSISGKAFQNYSDKYFILLSFFNSNIRFDYEKYCSISEDEIKLWQIFSKYDPSWQKKWSIFFGNVNESDILHYAQDNKLPGKLTYIGKDIKKLNSCNYLPSTYALILLSIYGRNKNFSIDEIIANLMDFPADKIEFIALFFGINNGYSKLEKKYPFINKYSKLRLNSLLDYYTIESIYQFAFNNVSLNGNFEYIDNTFHFPEPNADYTGFLTYRILDVVVIQNILSETQVLSIKCSQLERKILELEYRLLELTNIVQEITKSRLPEAVPTNPPKEKKAKPSGKSTKKEKSESTSKTKKSDTPGLF